MKVKLPKGIWALGFVSLFMDTSSELIHSLLPLFMVSVLHADIAFVGLIEGAAEMTAMITKIFSGYISDVIGKRKPLVLIGYGVAALSKPLFPLANTLSLVFIARFIDRIGKGIRGAPRDALIGEISPPEIRGASYGLRQSLDTVGAFMGPLLAILFMFLFKDQIRSCLWVAVVPAIISVTILAFAVTEPEPEQNNEPKREKKRFSLSDLKNAGKPYWHLVGIGALMALAHFSEAFLLLKAMAVGMTMGLIPLVLVVMNIAYALSSYPAGILSDKFSRKSMLMIGLSFLILADGLLAFSKGYLGIFPGIILWGMHMGFSQGLLTAMIADVTSENIRGSAFGIFNFVSGITLFFASFLAGYLWDSYGASVTFLIGGCFCFLSLVALIFYTHKNEMSDMETI